MSCPRLDKNLFDLANSLVPNDIDYLVSVVGQEGTGKSNLALYLAWRFHQYEVQAGILSQPLNLEKQAIYSPLQFKADLLDFPKGTPVIVDEGALLLLNRKWQSKDSIDLNQIFMTFRNRNLFTIFVIPVFLTTDVYLRNYRTNVILRTRARWVETNNHKVFVRGTFDSFSKRKGFLTGIDPKAEGEKWKIGFTEQAPNMAAIQPALWEEYKRVSDLRKKEFIEKTAKPPEGKKPRKRKEVFELPEVEDTWS